MLEVSLEKKRFEVTVSMEDALEQRVRWRTDSLRETIGSVY